MKVANISQQNVTSYKNRLPQKQNFNGAVRLIGDANKALMKKIETGGFFLEFVLLDLMGMVLPRVYQGFNRNKKELGHLNYKAGTEEFLRESITGPSMFLIPLATVALAGKVLGKGVQINGSTMKKFTSIFKKTGSNMVQDSVEALQKGFAGELFDELFTKNAKRIKEASFAGLKSLEEYKQEFVKTLTEGLGNKSLKTKGKFCDLIADINSTYFKKVNTESIDVILPDKTASTVAGNMFDDARKFMTDIIPSCKITISDMAEKGKQISAEVINSTIEGFNTLRKNGRKFMCVVGAILLSSFLSIIPKIYQITKTNPALEGISEGGKK